MADHEDRRVVSFDSERLILVDAADREIGHASKADAHVGKGILHRAFSLFVFNSAGELLLQQRAPGKPLWPGYWANSCCSHPRGGEDMETATQRRLSEELGFTCPLEFVFKFQYRLGNRTVLGVRRHLGRAGSGQRNRDRRVALHRT